MNRTSIGWTDYSSNPIRYADLSTGAVRQACVKTSPGCANCYAESLALRFKRGASFTAREMANLRPFVDLTELNAMVSCKGAAGKRCFVGDMTDIFGEWIPDQLLDHLFAIFAIRSDVTWQVLTKRAARMREYLKDDAMPARARWISLLEYWRALTPVTPTKIGRFIEANGWPSLNPENGWPLENVWLGISAENQKQLEERVVDLKRTPAAVRFISAEPLLSPLVGLDQWLSEGRDSRPVWTEHCPLDGSGFAIVPGIDWVIVGGESGDNWRPCSVDWIGDIVGYCQTADVPVFVKQGAGLRPGMPTGEPRLDQLKQFPVAAALR